MTGVSQANIEIIIAASQNSSAEYWFYTIKHHYNEIVFNMKMCSVHLIFVITICLLLAHIGKKKNFDLLCYST